MSQDTVDTVRSVLGDHGKLAVAPSELDVDASLYDAGLTSHASVNVMLALEDAFDVEFPDAMLTRSVFETIGNIAGALDELQGAAA